MNIMIGHAIVLTPFYITSFIINSLSTELAQLIGLTILFSSILTLMYAWYYVTVKILNLLISPHKYISIRGSNNTQKVM